MSKQWNSARLECITQAVSKDPTIPTRTLARSLTTNHPELFPNIESARLAIRGYRGAKGDRDRHLQVFDNTKRKINVPDSDTATEPTEPVKVALKGHWTIISDIHAPYHSKPAIEAALEHSDKIAATDGLLINGDLIDFYQASKWSRNPNARRINDELTMVREFMKELSRYYPRIVYKFGNHERRFTSYLYANAPEIADMPCLKLEQLFINNKEKIEFEGKIEFIGAQQIIYAGDYLTILHGHEFASSAFSPVNPARGAFLKAKTNCIVGHHHKPSAHVETDARRVVTSTFSLGCLSDLSPPYAPINSYTHGFATMHMDGNDFEINNYRITNNYKVR